MKKPLGRLRHRWEGNIRIYLKEIGIEIEGIGLVQLRIDIIESPCECKIELLNFISH